MKNINYKAFYLKLKEDNRKKIMAFCQMFINLVVMIFIGITATAQPTATLSGSTICVGSLLTVNSSVPYDTVEWKLGSSTVQTTLPLTAYNIVSIGTADGLNG